MNNLSFKELQSRYTEALELINDLSETLEKREWDIILLKENISELEEILMGLILVKFLADQFFWN